MGGAAKGLLTGRYVDPANMVRQLTWGIPQHTQQTPNFSLLLLSPVGCLDPNWYFSTTKLRHFSNPKKADVTAAHTAKDIFDSASCFLIFPNFSNIMYR